MLSTFIDWARTLLNLWEDVREQRGTVREHEKRIRDLEEAFKLMAQEIRHSREAGEHEREKLIMRFENLITKQLPPPKPRKKSD